MARESIVLAICPWCTSETPIPEGIWTDGDLTDPFLCENCGEPLEARVSILTAPVGCAIAVEKAIATGQWVVAE